MTVKNRVRVLVKTGNNEKKKQGGRLLEQFLKSNEEQKMLINELLFELCGFSLTQILEEIKNEKRGL